MTEMTVVIADNITRLMRQRDMTQSDLAKACDITPDRIRKMLNASQMISIPEMQRIADCFHVSLEELMKEKNNPYSGDVVKAFMGEVTTKEAKEALETLDELAELILFHAKIRENAKNIMDTWEM